MTVLLVLAGVFYVLVALLMVGAVLLQESKGGGLAALGGTRAETAFGASNPLRRLTVVLAVIFFVLASLITLGLAPDKSKAGVGLEPKKPEGVEAVVDVPDEGKPAPAPAEKTPAGKKEDAQEPEAAPAPAPAPEAKDATGAGEKTEPAPVPPAPEPAKDGEKPPAGEPAEKPAG